VLLFFKIDTMCTYRIPFINSTTSLCGFVSSNDITSAGKYVFPVRSVGAKT